MKIRRHPLLSRRQATIGALGALLSACIVRGGAHAAETTGTRPRTARALDWMEMLPERERQLLIEAEESDAPVSAHDYLGEDGPAMKQTGSFATNPKLNGQFVKVPGFVVPLKMTDQTTLHEFLLVPYYGACIHIPPPPPNQIVFGKLQKPARIRTIWDPYWVTGILSVARKETEMATAAYSILGEKLEPYEY